MDDLKTKLIQLLTKIFQFENEDLDFGVYKILNYKKDEISQFIEKDLVEEINNELDLLSSEEKKSLNQDLERMKKKLQDLGVTDYENNPKYLEKKEELEELEVSEELEKDIYNHIYAFFSRYYDKGDFISKRRYGRNNKYAIPYNGEETLLYWANHDQYYIKSSEFLQKYSFKIPNLLVNFKIIDAEEEKGNVKSEENKFFIIFDDPIYTFEDKELNIFFEYRGLTQEEKRNFSRPNQDKINEYNLEVIFNVLNEEPKFAKLLKHDNNDKTILEKHLRRYTARNTYDYFIHKDLKGFLDKELDFYIKNEILDLSDITLLDKDKFHSNILKIKVIRDISSKIIEFLAQIENFQKRLWEKKKFVLSTNYCITLDHIDERHYPGILENNRQVEEWKNLYNFEIEGVESLKQNPTLMIDTKFFDENFKIDVLSEIDDLDNKITGILINSDNFHALNLLNEKYREKIKCCYIDPPYNAKSSEILYKNTFKHSSWLSLMENRLKVAKQFLRQNGVLVVAIDENEQEKLGLLLDNIFNIYDYNKTCVTLIHNPGGIQGDNFSYTHEFAYFVFPSNGTFIGKKEREDANIVPLRDWGGEESKRESARNCFYPILVKDNIIIGFGDVCDDDFHPHSPNIRNEDGSISVYPIDQNKIERKWRNARQSVENILDELFCEDNGEITIKRNKSLYRYKTVWTDKIYNSNSYGSKILNQIMGDKVFSFPKSLYNVKDCLHATTQNEKNALILDFFAGSGTTGHAVLNLNRDDEGNRRFILIEMGQYFDSVLKPRMQKVIFTENWKDGKPEDTEGYSHQIIKYQSLEQYEDSLENIEFSQKALDEFSDYFVHYMLDFETRDSQTFLNIDKMENPFDYKIKILDDYQLKTVPVDLPETYNYLIGIDVNKIQSFENNEDNNRRYYVIHGSKGVKNILVIWRDIKGFDPAKDRDFIEKNIKNKEFDEIHLNGDSLIPDAVLIEENFKTLMNGN